MFLRKMQKFGVYSTAVSRSDEGKRGQLRPRNKPHGGENSRARRYTWMNRIEIWLKGLLAAAVSGGAGGVLTGFAAVGIDPQHFNLQTGMGATLRIAAAAALINAVIGVAAYLQKSPLPQDTV